MKPTRILILFAVVFGINLPAVTAQIDSLLQTFVKYNSDFEEQAFQKYLGGDTTDLAMIITAADPEMTAEKHEAIMQEVKAFINGIEPGVNKKKSLKKKIKYIFKEVHNTFFKKYEYIATFDEIFDNGVYNCVTGSIMYSIVFDHFNIPYNIMYSINHVYLVADPDGESIAVESTDPSYGWNNNIDYRIKKKVVEYMHKQKFVSDEEMEEKSIEEIYDEEFMTDEVISNQHLASILYYNEGVKHFYNEQEDSAFQQQIRSRLIHQFIVQEIQLMAALVLLSQDYKYETIDEVKQLIALYYLIDDVEANDALVVDFAKMTERYLIEQSDTTYYTEIYNQVNSLINDSVLLSEISYIFNYETGRFYNLRKEFRNACPYLIQAYLLQPDDVEIQSLLGYALINELYANTRHDEMTAVLDNYQHSFPELINTLVFNEAWAFLYLTMAYDNFNMNEVDAGQENLTKFEAVYNARKMSYVSKEFVGSAYYAAWRSLLRAKQDDDAERALKKGLEYAPYDENLNRVNNY
jgi:hypothetical protein